MRLKRPHAWRHTIHFCGWDKMCQDVYSPWYLYFHFLENDRGNSPRINLTPPRVRRRHEAWEDSLDWQQTSLSREKTGD